MLARTSQQPRSHQDQSETMKRCPERQACSRGYCIVHVRNFTRTDPNSDSPQDFNLPPSFGDGHWHQDYDWAPHMLRDGLR